MPADEERRRQLIDLVHQGEAKGQDIVNHGRDVVGFGQRVSDLGLASEDVLNYVLPSGTDLESMMQAWQYVNKQEDEILHAIMPISLASTATSGYAADYSMTVLANPDVVGFVTPDKQGEARQAVGRLSSVIDSQAEKNKVLSLFGEYGLNTAAAGRESPRDLFQTAYAAFEKPVIVDASASASLIPARECINTVIAELIRRRPTQEEARSQHDKILTICHQCAGPGVTEVAIQSMASRWDGLVNELSGAKNKQHSRDEWREALRRATLFLIELLQSLDRSKMK